MRGGKNGSRGTQEEERLQGEEKAGKRASRVPCKGHTEAKVRVDIPEGCPVGSWERCIIFLSPCTPDDFCLSGWEDSLQLYDLPAADQPSRP